MGRFLHKKWWFFFLFCGFLLLWSLTTPPVASPTDVPQPVLLHQGWSQVIDGEITPLDDIQNFQPVAPGEPMEFICTLPSLHDDDVLLFYTEHLEVHCTVDDQIVQEFKMNDSMAMLKTPGRAWNQIGLKASMSGKVCTLIFTDWITSCDALPDIYMTINTAVENVRARILWLPVIIACLLALVAATTFVGSLLWKNPLRKRFFSTLCQLYCFLLLWLLAELNVFDLFFGRPIFSYLLSAALLRIIPISIWQFATNTIPAKRHPKLSIAMGVWTMVNSIIPWILLFGFGIPLVANLWIHTLTLTVLLLCIFFLIVHKLINFKTLPAEEYPCIPLLILLLGVATDTVVAIISPSHFKAIGLGTSIGCLLYTVTIYILLLSQDAQAVHERIALRDANRKLETASLMAQMKSHFLFNTLNAISALCKENPREADRATVLFASYLRSHMYLTNQQEPIPAVQELKLVNAYLSIEKIRFGADLEFTIHKEFTDFQLPPLSIQPLVENAVVHGIRGKTGPGAIHVTLQKSGNTAQVIVTDNGVGFDSSVAPRDTSVGLRNLRKRLDVMCQGALVLTSQPGVGTTATLSIPLPPPRKYPIFTNIE